MTSNRIDSEHDPFMCCLIEKQIFTCLADKDSAELQNVSMKLNTVKKTEKQTWCNNWRRLFPLLSRFMSIGSPNFETFLMYTEDIGVGKDLHVTFLTIVYKNWYAVPSYESKIGKRCALFSFVMEEKGRIWTRMDWNS